MAEDDHDQPADTMRGRVPGSRLRLWFLLEADRWVVTAVTLGLVFASLVVIGTLDPTPLRRTIAGSDPVETLFQALVAAIVTGVTLVVTINQLVLSQELGAVGDQRERMEAAMAFRRDVEDALGVAAVPAAPAGFLRTIVEAAGERGEALRDAVPADADGALRERVGDDVDGLASNADEVAARLDGAEFGTFDVVAAALDFNYSWKISEARRLRAAHGDQLGEEAAAAVDELVEALELFGPAREHVKTLYFQWELIDLSRAILYASVPALVVATGAVLYLADPGTVTGSTAGVDHVVLAVSGATAAALLPFAILLSYVLRIATVAKRTLAIGPFILRGSARDADRRE
ncbi:MAG: hypothetical protein ABEJ92_06680 [Halobacteriales archaeon]